MSGEVLEAVQRLLPRAGSTGLTRYELARRTGSAAAATGASRYERVHAKPERGVS